MNYSKCELVFRHGIFIFDRMHTGRAIEFDILLPIEFPNAAAADSFQNYSCRLERENDGNVCIAVYSTKDGDILEKIYWQEYQKYKCLVSTVDSSENLIVKETDFEPCAATFDYILDQLTDAPYYNLDCLAYWVEPAFHQLILKDRRCYK